MRKNDRRPRRPHFPSGPVSSAASPTPRALFREGCALPVLLETPRFLILNKPAGLAVHPGPSTRDSVETRLVPHPRGGPWLAHRLDADTAGCLLIARRKTALLEAQDAFRHRRTHKLYWAVVVGNPPEDSGSITGPLLKRSDRNGWRMVVDANGDNARTDWRVLGRKDGLCWLELDLLTGRTHQARAHCAAALGTPILGDPVYGTSCPAGLHLLARRLEVTVPESVLAAEASPSPAMAATLKDFGWDSQF